LAFVQQLSRVTPAMLDVLEILVSAEGNPHGFAIAERAGRPTVASFVRSDRSCLPGVTAVSWR
jgi:hypothetical protein